MQVLLVGAEASRMRLNTPLSRAELWSPLSVLFVAWRSIKCRDGFILSYHCRFQSGSGTHNACFIALTGGSFDGVKAVRAWSRQSSLYGTDNCGSLHL